MFLNVSILIETMNRTAVTSRKGGNGPGRVSPLVPVQSRTGTHGGIGPGSCAPGAGRATGAIGPGSSGPFGPGWWDEPGPMGLAPGPPPLVPVGGLNRDHRCDALDSIVH